MPTVVRQSVLVHRMAENVSIEFEDQRELFEGFTAHCKDWMGQFILKLQARGIVYYYDELNRVLRVTLKFRNTDRVVQYSII